jgi:HlyD family type I secretion membrane fusion protein
MMFNKEKAGKHDAVHVGRVPLGRRQRRLLSETSHIEEELIPAYVKPILIVVALVVVAFVGWATFTRLTEVARAPGEIIPSGQNKVVQHLDGGVVAEIAVEEHKLVKQGEVLLRMDGTQIKGELRQMEARLAALRLRAERLVAFTAGRQPDFSAYEAEYPELVAGQKEIYKTQVAALGSSLSVLDRQVAQRSDRIDQLNKALDSAKQHQALTGELSDMRQDLASRHLVNRSVLLETQRAKVTADGEANRIVEELNVIDQERAEVKSRRVDTVNQLKREALAEMGTVKAEAAEVEETINNLKSRVNRLVITAPSRGYVQDIKVQTVGQVVQPGAVLMQIVPDDTPLEAMIRIAPKDIGYIKVGQPVKLRVTTFDYARFGLAKGSLKRVTASSVMGEDNKPYYRGWVRLEKPYVGDVPGRYPLQAGMAVDAEIVTGDKTLLAYLAKPVIDAFSSSFRER